MENNTLSTSAEKDTLRDDPLLKTALAENMGISRKAGLLPHSTNIHQVTLFPAQVVSEQDQGTGSVSFGKWVKSYLTHSPNKIVGHGR